MVKKIIILVLSLLLYVLISFIFVFYLDLANGPMILLFVESALIIALFVFKFIARKKKVGIRVLSFVAFVLLSVIVSGLAKPVTSKVLATNAKQIKKTEVLQLANGKVQGVLSEDEKVQIYAGIPYAKAPIGELRWKEPQDVENWSDVKDCSYFAPKSMQPASNSVMDSLIRMYSMKGWYPNYKMQSVEPISEDSLYLNIWRPNNNKTALPIMVYIHGGSLTSGSSAFEDYNGEAMAKKDVIMITIAYRLGVFGYFAHPDLIQESANHTTGNYGLLDQIKALEWVNNNASYFGGDKNNITIAGESAGSSSVSAICTSPLAKNLFKNAIGESSSIVGKVPPHTFRTLEKALETGQKIMEEQKVSSIEQLRQIPAEKLVKTNYTNSSMTLDGYALTHMPYEVYQEHNNNETNLLNGYNVKEADAFVVPQFLLNPTNKKNIKARLTDYFDEEAASQIIALYQDQIEEDAFSAFNEIISVYWFIYPHEKWTEKAINAGVKVYRYQFRKENGYYGTYHSGEMIYAYGNIYRSKQRFAYDNEDEKLSEIMLNYWSNFAKYGNPNGENVPRWNEYDLTSRKVLILDQEIVEQKDQYVPLYYVLENYISRANS